MSTWRRDERGSMTLWFALIAVALLAVLALVVDGSARLRGYQEVDQIAREAARQAGQRLTGSALAGTGVSVNPAQGVSAAQSYLAAMGASGSVTIVGDTITVSAQKAFVTPYLAVRYVATGTESARTVRVVNGREG